MTSLPVTAGVNGIYPGAQAAPQTVESRGENSFSDMLKSRTGEKEEVATDVRPTKTEVSGRSDKVKAYEKQEKPVEDEISEEVAVAIAAEQMVEKVADELDIPVEDVLAILENNNLTPMDLLTEEGLKTALLAISGEEGMASFITNQELFQSFKNLKQDMESVIDDFAKATGMDVEDAKAFVESFIEEAEDVMSVETETADENAEVSETNVLQTDVEEGVVKTEAPETMTRQDSNQSKHDNADNADMNMKNQNPMLNPQMNQTSNVERMFGAQENVHFMDADTEMIMNQVTDYMRGQVREGISELDMQLHPANLGNLHVKLTSREGIITAQFTAQDETVKAALESQVVQLRETFKEQGITVEAVEVMVSSHKFEQSYEQAHSEGERREEATRTQKPRRIHLDALTEEEVLTEDEELAKEMLMANGGTVDYMA